MAREVHPNAIMGTIAAWTRRGWPVVFAGGVELAAQFSFRFLVGPLKEAERSIRAVERGHHLSRERV